VDKRPALPYPAQAVRDREFLAGAPVDTKHKLGERLQQEYLDLQYRMELLEARLDAVACWQPAPSASANPAQQFRNVDVLNNIQSATAQLSWDKNLNSRFNKLGDSAGNTSGLAWCNGIHLQDGLVLTTAQCFIKGGGWQRPNNCGVVPSTAEVVSLFDVRFCAQHEESHFKIKQLLHYRPWGLDCSIIQLETLDHLGGAIALPPALLNYLPPEAKELKLADTSVFLSDSPTPVIKQTNDQTRLQKVLRKVSVIAHEHNTISFSSTNDVSSTLAGTPLITYDGHVVGIKLTQSTALDIRSIPQLLE